MPQSKLYFENDLATIREHPDGYAIFTYHEGPRKLADFKAVLTHLGNLLAQRQWYRILGDQRLMAPTTPEETTLIAAFWQHQTPALGHGLCVASILAKDVFARLTATQLRAELKVANIGYKLFDDEASAGAWLRAQTTCPPLEQSK